MKVYDLFNDESALFARIAALRKQVAEATERRRPGDAVFARLAAFDGKLDAVRKEIVATTEGGAITGEERLREHTDQLYGAISSWEGPPSQYQLDNTIALRAQLTDIDAEFSRLTKTLLPPLNKALREGGMESLDIPAQAAFNDEKPGGGGVPKNLRLWN